MSPAQLSAMMRHRQREERMKAAHDHDPLLNVACCDGVTTGVTEKLMGKKKMMTMTGALLTRGKKMVVLMPREVGKTGRLNR